LDAAWGARVRVGLPRTHRPLYIIMVEIAVRTRRACVLFLARLPFRIIVLRTCTRVLTVCPTHNNTYENNTCPGTGRRINSVTATHTGNDKLSETHHGCVVRSRRRRGRCIIFSHPVVGKKNRTRFAGTGPQDGPRPENNTRTCDTHYILYDIQ